MIYLSQCLENLNLVFLQVLRAIHVLHVARRDVKVEVRCVVPDVLVLWQVVVELLVEQQARFVGPAACYVTNGVTTTTEDEQWQIEALDEVDTVSVSLN